MLYQTSQKVFSIQVHHLTSSSIQMLNQQYSVISETPHSVTLNLSSKSGKPYAVVSDYVNVFVE